MSSDLPGVNPATLNGILYYRLMTKWSGLGDSIELSRVGLSHSPTEKKPVVYQPNGGSSSTAIACRRRLVLKIFYQTFMFVKSQKFF
jgi:hypothetical protein